jgi:hypothetical protein
MITTLTLTALLTAGTFELPPEAYERARAEATSVIVLDQVRARGIGFRPRGDCTVRGRVSAVERGTEYRVGQRVTLAVPCISYFYNPSPGPWAGFQENVLTRSRSGRAFLTGGEVVLKGYDILQP